MENKDAIPQEIITKGEPNVTFKVDGREDASGYLSALSPDSTFGLVLIQEWWGLNKSIMKTADRYAEYGFRVLSPDLYRGKCASDRETAGHLMKGLDFGGAVQDIRGAVLYLKNQLKCTKVGVLGFCMGGALTIAATANVPEIDAASPFYGVPDLSQLDLTKVKVPVWAYFGELDDAKGFSAPEDARRLEKAFNDAGANFKLSIIPGAGHAFMNQDSKAFNEQAYKQVIAENTNWFKEIFAK